jgi:hypothetical protein
VDGKDIVYHWTNKTFDSFKSWGWENLGAKLWDWTYFTKNKTLAENIWKW